MLTFDNKLSGLMKFLSRDALKMDFQRKYLNNAGTIDSFVLGKSYFFKSKTFSPSLILCMKHAYQHFVFCSV